jgi:hypothetical protein
MSDILPPAPTVGEFQTAEWDEAYGWWRIRDLTPEELLIKFPPPAPGPVILQCTPLQFRRALRAAGIKAQADAYLATLSEEAQETYEYASVILRTDPFIEGARQALGMSAEDADNLFLLARNQ